MALDQKIFKRRVEALKTLPTLPIVMTKIMKMVKDDRVSASSIGAVIEADQVLSARVLKIANSSFYGYSGKISSASHAVVMLGVNTIKGLVLGTTVFELMEKGLAGLWAHSMGCATTASIIARKLGADNVEDIATAGLLHDIGKVVIFTQLPRDFSKIIEITDERKATIREVEKELLGITHDEVSQWVCEKWRFPVSLREPVAYHHTPGLAKYASLETAIVHLADILIRARGFGYGGDRVMPHLKKVAWDRLSLDYKTIEGIMVDMEEELIESEDIEF